MFENDETYGFISDRINFLMEHIPKDTHRPSFKPRHRSIRWISLYKCAKFIQKNKSKFENTRIDEVKTSLSKIEEKIGWQNLIQLLKMMKIFMMSLSKNRSSIADIIPCYIKASTELFNLNNDASLQLANYLRKLFVYKCINSMCN